MRVLADETMSFSAPAVPDLHPHGEQGHAEAPGQPPTLRHPHLPHRQGWPF